MKMCTEVTQNACVVAHRATLAKVQMKSTAIMSERK
jgi:hypothetical protein